MILEHVKLTFDPFNSLEYPRLDEVFSNPLTQQMWLGIRPNHLINQHFEENILVKAVRIQELLDKKKVITPQHLQGILGAGSERRKLPADMELCNNLIPFITGEKKITYEIEIDENDEIAKPTKRVTPSAPAVKLKKGILDLSCLLALAVMKGIKEVKRGKVVKVYDLASYLLKLKSEDIDISHISMNVSVGKYWSEDIAKYITESELQGRMRQFRDEHIWFGPDCYNECLSALEVYGKDDPSAQPTIKKAMKILNLEIFP